MKRKRNYPEWTKGLSLRVRNVIEDYNDPRMWFWMRDRITILGPDDLERMLNDGGLMKLRNFGKVCERDVREWLNNHKATATKS